MQPSKRFNLPCLVWLLLWLLLWTMPALAAEPVRLTILHTNDTHGHLLPFSYPETALPGSEAAALPQRRNIGGIARRAAMAKRLRAELRARGATVWLVDAGDFCDGSAFSLEYQGEADIAAMNAAGYDFATLGNHEFTRSLAQTKKLVSLAGYPIVCANVIEKSTGKPFTRPYLIRSVGPMKIALFGLITREAAAYPAARSELEISDEVESARRMANQLKPLADIVIALSHCGERVDQTIAQAVPGIDLIIGGHSHSRLPSGEFVWHGDELKTGDVNGTIIVQNHQWGGELGRLDLLFVQDGAGAWHVERYRARLLPVTAGIEEDPATAAVVAKYWQPIAARYGTVLGQAAADFITLQQDRGEYNLVADAVRESLQTDFALENIGGVRAPLPKGPITLGDLVAMDPFDNAILTFAIDGARLKRLLLREQPAVSGLRYRIQEGRLVEAACGGQPISDERIYSGAINSFYARILPPGIAASDSGRRRLELLADYIRRKGTLTPAHDGRRIINGPRQP